MPIFNSLLSHLSRKKSEHSVESVCHRFIQVFQDHGVEISQIPRLFPHIQLADLQDTSKLLTALSPAMLDQVAKLFGIRVQWLEGVEDRIYEFQCCDKRPATLLEHLARLVEGKEVWLTYPLRILCTKKRLDRNGKDLQLIAPVLVEKIAELGEETIFRYHIYQDGFDWEYEPCRLELKAIARIIYQRLGTSISMFEISASDMEEVLEGRLIPKRCFRGALQSNPSLEDYALASSESVVARETEELEGVLRYIDEQGLNDFRFVISRAEVTKDQDLVQPMNGAKGNVSVKANAVKAANKKHARTNEIKQRFVQFYRDHEKEHESKSAAAKTFFKCALSEKDRLEFKDINTAQRVFLEALRKAGATPQQ